MSRFPIFARDHHKNQFIAISFGRLTHANQLPGFHNSYAVSGLQDVAHDVRDVDYTTPALAQTSGKIKNVPGLGDAQRRRTGD